MASISVAVEPLAEPLEPAPPSNPVSARASVAVKVPSWFSSVAALRVAQLKSVDHLLVLDRGAVVGTVATRTLALAPLWQPVARSMIACTASVAPETSVAEARALMSTRGLDCLPVISGPLLVGLVTSEALAEDRLRAVG